MDELITSQKSTLSTSSIAFFEWQLTLCLKHGSSCLQSSFFPSAMAGRFGFGWYRRKIWSEFTTNVSKGTRHYSNAADSSFKLQLLESFRVAPPSTPLLDQWMHLSTLDTVVPPHYVPAFLIYKKEALQDASFDNIISTLQASLQRALVAFYPFSGRLKQNDKSTWQVHLNNQGAQFNIAETESELQEIQYYLPGPQQNMLAPPTSVTDTCGQGVSPVHIQVTRFKCGALAVCCSVHHHLADAQGMSLFVKSWADLARNGSANAPAITHDRTPLLVTRPPLPTAAASLPIFSRKGAPTSINPHQKTEAFLIDSSFIARAKQESSLSATTTFEAITSFFWQQIHKAQRDTGLLSDDQELATLCLMVNGRKQMGLPMGFVGNASVPVRTTAPVKELLQQPLSFGAERIRMGVKEVDRQYIMTVINHCESSDGNASYIRDDVVATSAVRLPMYDVDFGWGKPTFAGFQMPAPGALEGGLLYTPAPGADGAVAFVQLDHRVLDSCMKNERMEQMAFYYKQMFTSHALIGDR